MKAVMLLILVFSIAGCATLGTAPGTEASPVSSVAEATPSAPAMTASPSQDDNMGPRLIIPATGGLPVFAMPLGGDIFLPVTGGMPEIGMPISP